MYTQSMNRFCKVTMIMSLLVIGAILMTPFLSNAGQTTVTEIGSVVCIKRLLNGDDSIQVLRFTDPDNPFVVIFFTRVKSGQYFAASNPSNTSIAARLVAPVPLDEDGKQIINTTTKKSIITIRQSVFSKEMKIARFYDKEMNTLTYVVYSIKLYDGSIKHSLSVVPLGMPLTK